MNEITGKRKDSQSAFMTGSKWTAIDLLGRLGFRPEMVKVVYEYALKVKTLSPRKRVE